MKAQKLGQLLAVLAWVSACHTPATCTLGNAESCPSGTECYAGEQAKVGDRGVCVHRPAPLIHAFSPLEAAHGAELRIEGENFSADASQNSVTLNGIEAEILSATETEISVRVPKNMQCSGFIEVRVGDKTATSATRFTYVPTVMVSTFAGDDGIAANKQGVGGEARFSWPVGLAINAQGTLYVADNNNHGIREITPEGEVGWLAAMNAPADIAIGSGNNLYVVSHDSNLIQRITPAGNGSPFAGSGAAGFADGEGTLAEFNSPWGIAVDATGNFFVADSDNHRIRKITPAGVVSTLAGSGTAGFADGEGALAEFNGPRGIAVDAAGNLWVADSTRIRKITPAGVVSTFAGTEEPGFSDGDISIARFDELWDIVIDAAGNLLVADFHNNRIRKITPEREVSTFAGSGWAGFADGQGHLARFHGPAGLAIDAEGNLFVADAFNNRIRKIILE